LKKANNVFILRSKTMTENERFFGKNGVAIATGVGAIVTAKLINHDVVLGGPGFAGSLEWCGVWPLLWGVSRVAMGGIALRAGKYLNEIDEDPRALAGLPLFANRTNQAELDLRDIDPRIVSLVSKINLARRDDEVLVETGRMTAQLEADLLEGLRGGIRTANDRTLVGNVVDGAYLLDQLVPIEPYDPATPTTVEGEKHWFDYLNALVQPQLAA
jgi:hypothetical protein